MAKNTDYGCRFIPSLIDEIARDDPTRAWASVPKDENDLTKGFVDINYRQFATAINKAAWFLESRLAKPTGSLETIAYAGPKDLRYPVIAVAAAKLGRKILVPSPFASKQAQLHVLSVTDTTHYFFGSALADRTRGLLETTSIEACRFLEFDELFKIPEAEAHLADYAEVEKCPFEKTWDEAGSDPWIIFHTSGTTGMPKPIVYTHSMMVSLDAAKTMPDADRENYLDHFSNSRWHTPLPTLHFVGMTACLQFTLFLNQVVVVGGSGPATGVATSQIIEFGNLRGVLLPPSLIEDTIKDPHGFEQMKKLEYVYFGGSPLPRSTAEKLLPYTKVKPGIGTTEAGAYFLNVVDDEDWEWYSFRPAMGIKLEHRSGNLYELIFHRQKEFERYQQLFQVFPDMDTYPTKDLWNPHPTKHDRWRYAGRIDDFVVLSHGEDLYASKLEEVIIKHPEVTGALVGGEGKPKPFLIVELTYDLNCKLPTDEARLEYIWPAVEEANKEASEYVQLIKGLVMFTDPSKPLVRTVKGTTARRPNLEAYAEEIEQLYK